MDYETKQATKKDLIERGLQLAGSSNEDDMNMALLLFKKAISIDANFYKHSDEVIRFYIYFLESALNITSATDNLHNYLIDKVSYKRSGGDHFPFLQSLKHRDKITAQDIRASVIIFPPQISKFLNEDLGKSWVKSKRYDALVAQLKEWDEEDKLDSERMKKIKEIIGE